MVTLVCKQCGQPFDSNVRSTKFCSRECYGLNRMMTRKTPPRHENEKNQNEVDRLFVSFATSNRMEIEKTLARRERQRRRDVAFEAWELENGFSDHVIETENTRTVIRGRVCGGFNPNNTIRINA